MQHARTIWSQVQYPCPCATVCVDTMASERIPLVKRQLQPQMLPLTHLPVDRLNTEYFFDRRLNHPQLRVVIQLVGAPEDLD